MDAQPDFTIKHFIPGRLRVAFPMLVSNRPLTRRLQAHLSNVPGVICVTANHLCGSVTIYYDAETMEKKPFLDLFMHHVALKILPPATDGVLKPEEQIILRNLPAKNRKKKGFEKLWNLAGGFFVGIGILGVFLPLLPTFPLFLLAAFCYWRGSPRFYRWITNRGIMGQLIKDFREGNGLPARVKSGAIASMWISIGISMTFILSTPTLRIILALGGIGATLYILRIKTADPVMNLSERQGALAKID